MTVVDQILLLILILFTAVACLKDIKINKIPNWIPLTLFAIWIVAIVVKWILADMQILNIEVIDVLITCAKQVLASAIICCVLAASVAITNKRRKKLGLAQKSAFGMGDVKLLMVVCLYLGTTWSCACIIFACLSFLIYVFIKRLSSNEKISHAPFAPFIFIGEIISIFVLFVL